MGHHAGAARDAGNVAQVHRPEAAIRPFAVAELASGQIFVHPDQLIRILVRQRTQQHGVHDAEDRRVRADPEREGKHDDAGEAWRATQCARRVLQIAAKIVEPDERARIALQLLPAQLAAKIAPQSTPEPARVAVQRGAKLNLKSL